MILPYLNFKRVFSYKTSFLDLYSLQNFETIISCRKLTSLFSLSHATKCHALDFTWRRVWLGGGNAQETKQNKKQQASKQKTNKQKQSNENFENLWTQGPITVNCRL